MRLYNHNFFSDNFHRYSRAGDYADSKGHGRVDLPLAVIYKDWDRGMRL